MAPETSPKGLRGRSPPRVVIPTTTNHVNVNGTTSRTPVPGPSKKKATATSGPMSRGSSRPTNTRVDSGHKLTVAEQYANAHSKRDKDNAGTNKKPIFDWISRKLGKKTDSPGIGSLDTPTPSPRVPTSSTLPGPSSPRGRFASLPVTAPSPDSPFNPANLSPTKIFPTLSRDDSNRFGRSESVSLRLYPHSIADSERMRIREANNPYPSIPVPPPQRDSTLDSQSMSFLSRSRSPSLRSDASTRPRISFADDSSQRWSGADEDASIRPFPPSHPASPTRSASMISRSASASLLSPGGPIVGSFRPPSPPLRPGTQYSATDSTNSSEGDRMGRHSRRDSASTKPTTVLSIDSAPHIAHIAQAPSTLASPIVVGPSNQSSPLRHSIDSPPIERSSSQSSPGPVAGPSRGHETPRSPSSGSPMHTTPSSLTPPSISYVQAPKHSAPHPRDNPHPSSPPEPNASTVTLASSTFAIPGPLSPTAPALSAIPGPASIRLRDLSTSSIPIVNTPSITTRNPTPLATSPSVTFAPEPSTTPVNERPPSMVDSGPPSTHALSLYGNAPSMSVRTGGWHSGRTGVADGDASVRAVRRKGSWESNESRWSWRGGRPQGQGSSTPMGPPPSISPLNAMVEGKVDDDSSSKRSRLSKPEDGALGVPADGTMDMSLLTERPRSARDSVLTRDSFVTARSVMSRDGKEIEGMRALDLDQAEPVAAR